MQPAHGYSNPRVAESIGNGIGFEHLRRKGADSNEIACVDFRRLLTVGFCLEVSKVVPFRRARCQVEQAETWKRGDRLAALDKSRQRETQFEQLRIVST